MGGMGNFQLAQFFFFAHCLCRNFFLGEPLCTNFFFRQILLFFEQWNLDSFPMFLCFINYSTLTTDQRIQATLMQNLFENVHTVREEEATWSGRLPCAFFQSLPSGILSVKKGVGRQHTTFTSCQNAACCNIFFSFSLTGRLCSGGKRFDWSNVILAAYFRLRGSDTHIQWFSAVIVSGRHDLPSDARAFCLWPLLKYKVLHCG